MNKSDEAVNHTPMNRTQFHHAFPQLSSALLEEWPEIHADALSATNGELDKVVVLIVEKTGHTKTLARRQLEEIFRIVTSPSEARAVSGRGAAFAHDARAAAATVSEAAHDALHSVEDLIMQFEKKTGHLLRELRGNVLNEATHKIRKHWLISLISMLGLGFIVGMIVYGLNRDK